MLLFWQYFTLCLNSALTVIMVVLVKQVKHYIERSLFNKLVFTLFLFNLRGRNQVGVSKNIWKLSGIIPGKLLEKPGKIREKIFDLLVGTLQIVFYVPLCLNYLTCPTCIATWIAYLIHPTFPRPFRALCDLKFLVQSVKREQKWRGTRKPWFILF